MKLQNHLLLRAWILAAVFSFSAIRPSEAGVVTYIDLLDSFQSITNNATSTIASSNSIGGYRTLSLSISGSLSLPTILQVDDVEQELALSTPGSRVPSFEVKWGGLGGTNGLGGLDMTGGATNFTLNNSFLNFTLGSDQASSVTWTFTDSLNNVATYTQSFAPNPAIDYAISLASFSGAGIVQWTNINFITLSGGVTPGLDLSLSSPVTLAAGVPEPGTWAAASLLLLTALYVRWRRSRPASTEEIPAAA